MAKLRNLMEFNSVEMRNFLDSFDTIIADCDGVLWLGNTPIDKSFETLMELESMGKKIIFVSNNGTLTTDEYCRKFRKMGYPLNPEQLAFPTMVICWHLKKLKFDGKAFLVGTNTFRQRMKAEGIDVLEPHSLGVEETYDAIVNELENDADVKAVIIDFDVNINWIKMSKSIGYLKNKEILYLTGALDRKIAFGRNMNLLGIGAFVDIISEESNRKPIECAKPSETMKDYIVERFKLDDPSRCLFVGDSLENDMKFAHLCGFGKLWVASGIDHFDTITSNQQNSNNDDSSFVPDYYLPSLGHLLAKITR